MMRLFWLAAIAAGLARADDAVEVELGADGDAKPAPPFVVVPVTFNNQEKAHIDVHLGEDAVAAALRYVYDVRKINPDVKFASNIADILDSNGAAEAVADERRKTALSAHNNTLLKTAGKHVRRAEANREDRPQSAAADYLRASRRTGLEKSVVEKYQKTATDCMREEQQLREQLAKEAAERAIFDARVAKETAAREAAAARRSDAEAGLRALLEVEAARLSLKAEAGDREGNVGGRRFLLKEGDDAAAAAARACAASYENPCDGDAVVKTAEAFEEAGAAPGGRDPAALMAEAEKALAAGDAEAAVAAAVRGRRDVGQRQSNLPESIEDEATAKVAENLRNLDAALAKALDDGLNALTAAGRAVDQLTAALDPSQSDARAAWATAASTLAKLVRSGRPLHWAVWLARARMAAGDAAGAEQAAGAALQALETTDKAAMRTPFRAGEPKTLALSVGAAAALERGRLDKSIRFVQAGLRHDPDSPPLKTQYNGLKELKRKVETVDKHLKKGYPMKAVDALDEAVGALDSLSAEFEGSRLEAYRATLHVRSCHAHSRVRRHEVALPSCHAAVAAATPGDATAYAARAAALERDNDYDAAVRDWRAAVEANGGERAPPDQQQWTDDAGETHDLRRRLQMCRREEDNWEKRRDHAKVLDLPANLGDLVKERKCKWLKKRHKEMARTWHPDKARGDPDRAARKMREVSEAKEALTVEYGCKS